MWILWKMRLWKYEFCEKCDFQNVNFWINWGFLPQCALCTKSTLQSKMSLYHVFMLIFDLHYQDLHYVNMRNFTSYSKILNDLRCEIGKIELTKLLRTSWLMALGLYTVRRNADYGEGKRRLDFRTLEYTGAFVEFGSTPGTQSTPEQSTTDFKVTSPSERCAARRRP